MGYLIKVRYHSGVCWCIIENLKTFKEQIDSKKLEFTIPTGENNKMVEKLVEEFNKVVDRHKDYFNINIPTGENSKTPKKLDVNIPTGENSKDDFSIPTGGITTGGITTGGTIIITKENNYPEEIINKGNNEREHQNTGVIFSDSSNDYDLFTGGTSELNKMIPTNEVEKDLGTSLFINNNIIQVNEVDNDSGTSNLFNNVIPTDNIKILPEDMLNIISSVESMSYEVITKHLNKLFPDDWKDRYKNSSEYKNLESYNKLDKKKQVGVNQMVERFYNLNKLKPVQLTPMERKRQEYWTRAQNIQCIDINREIMSLTNRRLPSPKWNTKTLEEFEECYPTIFDNIPDLSDDTKLYITILIERFFKEIKPEFYNKIKELNIQ